MRQTFNVAAIGIAAAAALDSAVHARKLKLEALLVGASAAAIFACTIGPRIMLDASKEGGAGNVTVEDLEKLSVEFKKVSDELKKFGEDAAKQIKQHGDITTETKGAVDKMLLKQSELDGRLTEIEQKLVRRGNNEPTTPKSIGEQFVEDEGVKAMCSARKGTAKVNFKTVSSASGSAGVLVQPDRQAGIITPQLREFTVRQLLTPGRTTSNLIEYLRELVFTNAAEVVTEGAEKPESNITFEEKSTPVRTIAHWLPATKQIMDDAAMLMSYIDGRLRYGLEYVEEQELLKGSGAGQHLHGIIPQATAYSAAFVPDFPNRIDSLRLAILQAELADYPVTGIVMHPTDWAHIELAKDTTGRYLFANPGVAVTKTMWGKPVVTTQAVDLLEFLVGAFRLGAQIFDREDANVQISTEDRDNFIKNMVTIRAEERLALAVYRPAAFITGDFPNLT